MPDAPVPLAAQLRREALTAGRFVVVGLIATATHAGVALALLWLGVLPAFPANVIAFLVAFLVSFTGHHVWSFPGTGDAARRMRRFFLLALAGFLVNSGALAAWLEWTPWPDSLGILVAIAVVPAVTFLGARLWAFAGSAPSGQGS
ncbi:GtrA family protein [Polymorphum gilvum]|uniref:GtrA-like protein n=1 Tax=Polymorphum gilvum (strain LMG 25793 / CGMCC 1.9160 / SL003B-26A1) TaxID=991905 RepID=F2J322_POLGS|nr:GtrA family protein [Polymorphum gilvum]ADZ68892.1 GtrA-like protein [Polymorphum gilvum SL003B-26A1]